MRYIAPIKKKLRNWYFFCSNICDIKSKMLFFILFNFLSFLYVMPLNSSAPLFQKELKSLPPVLIICWLLILLQFFSFPPAHTAPFLTQFRSIYNPAHSYREKANFIPIIFVLLSYILHKLNVHHHHQQMKMNRKKEGQTKQNKIKKKHRRWKRVS